MTAKVLETILTNHGRCTRDGNSVIVPEDTEASIYIALGSEPLIIDRVRQVDLEDGIAIIKTIRREVYVVAYEDVRAARFSNKDQAGY